MLRGSQGLTRGARGSQTGVIETTWRRLWAPEGLPGKALGSAWETPIGNFEETFDPKLDVFAANFVEVFFIKVLKLSFMFFVLPDLTDTS